MQTLHAVAAVRSRKRMLLSKPWRLKSVLNNIYLETFFISVSYQLHVMAASGCILMMGTRI